MTIGRFLPIWLHQSRGRGVDPADSSPLLNETGDQPLAHSDQVVLLTREVQARFSG